MKFKISYEDMTVVKTIALMILMGVIAHVVH